MNRVTVIAKAIDHGQANTMMTLVARGARSIVGDGEAITSLTSMSESLDALEGLVRDDGIGECDPRLGGWNGIMYWYGAEDKSVILMSDEMMLMTAN